MSLWLAAAFAAGMILGLLYFGGLWATVNRLGGARRPELLVLVSFVARAALVLTACYVVMGHRWERLVAYMAGFVLVRTLMVRHYREPALPASQPN